MRREGGSGCIGHLTWTGWHKEKVHIMTGPKGRYLYTEPDIYVEDYPQSPSSIFLGKEGGSGEGKRGGGGLEEERNGERQGIM